MKRIVLGVAAAALLTGGLLFARPQAPAAQGVPSGPATAAQLSTALDQLSSFDFNLRTSAARLIRRTPSTTTAPVLAAAARSHRDQFVRFRAMVLLTGQDEALARTVVGELVTDRNDRLRSVAYGWLEYHPDPSRLPVLLAALESERSEFVRPILTRAVAAHGADPRARQALLPLVLRGDDFFRGAVIDALGDHDGQYALNDIITVARLDGPLQDDAITAIGKLGDAAVTQVLGGLQRAAPAEVQPTVSASLCLIDVQCPAQWSYLTKSLAFATTTTGYQPLLRGVVHGLAMLAVRGRREALDALFDAGVPAQDPVRAPIALAIGTVATRAPKLMLDVLETRRDFDKSVDLVREAFDMLSEDYAEERFYVEIRQALRSAPAGSARQRVARDLLVKLEFE